MIRRQISLDEEEYEAVKQEAGALGVSIAEIVRRAVRDALPPRGKGAWMKYAGFVESGNPQSSQTIDRTVYGRRD